MVLSWISTWWYTLFVVNICHANAFLVLLFTALIFFGILALAKVSFQMITIFLLISMTYFSALLLPGIAVILIVMAIAIAFIIFESMKSISRES